MNPNRVMDQLRSTSMNLMFLTKILQQVTCYFSQKPSVTSNTTKKVAKLDKVIGDMKKYQIIDQQKETKPEAGESKPETEDQRIQQEKPETEDQRIQQEETRD